MTVVVMLFFWTVNRDTHQKMIVMQELTPLWGEQRAIGLDAILD